MDFTHPEQELAEVIYFDADNMCVHFKTKWTRKIRPYIRSKKLLYGKKINFQFSKMQPLMKVWAKSCFITMNRKHMPQSEIWGCNTSFEDLSKNPYFKSGRKVKKKHKPKAIKKKERLVAVGDTLIYKPKTSLWGELLALSASIFEEEKRKKLELIKEDI